jgi:hypothetical protein
VNKGFVRIGSKVVDGSVILFVEDSGPGIPLEKRDKLFDKFQSSLDSLSQGTGIGLSLCQDLAKLMNGYIDLDENFESGVDGCPGARFVVHLNTAPMDLHESDDVRGHDTTSLSTSQSLHDLPQDLRILFVDDDLVLRKLFCRSVKRITPHWDVQEASNGETAVRFVKECERPFDIIFRGYLLCWSVAVVFIFHCVVLANLFLSFVVRKWTNTWQASKSKCWEQKLFESYVPWVTMELFVV